MKSIMRMSREEVCKELERIEARIKVGGDALYDLTRMTLCLARLSDINEDERLIREQQNSSSHS